MNQVDRYISRDGRGSSLDLSSVPRWSAILGGSALAIYGITRRSKLGAALAAAGGLLAVGGTRISNQIEDIHTEASFTVNTSPAEAYRFWRNFENLPRFMSHLEQVRVTGDRWSEWLARGPMNTTIKWNAEIVDERENEWIVWRSLPGSELINTGSVHFRPAPGDRGTEITVAFQYRPPAGQMGRAFASLFGKDPEFSIREDLRHFKQLIETGEIPTTFGQPSGRRTAKLMAAHKVFEDNIPKPVRGVSAADIRPQEVRVS